MAAINDAADYYIHSMFFLPLFLFFAPIYFAFFMRAFAP